MAQMTRPPDEGGPRVGTVTLEPGATKNGDGRGRLPATGPEGANRRSGGARAHPGAAVRSDDPLPVPAPQRAPRWVSGTFARLGRPPTRKAGVAGSGMTSAGRPFATSSGPWR